MKAKTPEVHTTRAHAKLGPSSAERWINCPGSIRASEGIDPRTSRYAAEGTAAHELASAVLEFGTEASDYLGQFINIDATETQHIISWSGPANERNIWLIDDEMVEAVDTYSTFVRGLIDAVKDGVAIVDVEQRLDMTHIHPAIFGTGDAVVYDPVAQHLHVCDFKYGKGVVVAVEQNPQLFLYAAGAVRRYHNQPVRKLSCHVVQPRAGDFHANGGIKSWETDILELFDFEGEIALAAARTEEKDAPRNAGDWCRFCPAAPICPTNRDAALADAMAEFDVVTGEGELPSIDALSAAQRGHILRTADRILNWVTTVQEWEHGKALAGDPPDGFKLVAKRATRKWKVDEDTVYGHLAPFAGEDGDMAHFSSEPKLLSPAQIEKVIGKKNFEKVAADLVVKQSSGTNLVEISDPRPAVSSEAAAEFSAVDV